MKRNLFITLLLLVAVFCISCKKNPDFKYDKSSPDEIVLTANEEIESISINGVNYSTRVTSLSGLISADKLSITFDRDYFLNYFEGLYKISLNSEKKTTEYDVLVSGYGDTSTVSIKKSEFFNVNADKYFVLFTQPNCNPCKTIADDIAKFIDFSKSVNTKSNIPVYSLDNDVVPSHPSLTDLTGVSSNIQMSTVVSLASPMLMLVENGVITVSRRGASGVKGYMNAYLAGMSDAKSITVNKNFTSYTHELSFTPTSIVLSGPGKLVNLSNTINGKSYTIDKEFVKDFYNGTYQIRFYNGENIQFLYLNVKEMLDYNAFVKPTSEPFTYDKAATAEISIASQTKVEKIIINGNNRSVIIDDVKYYDDDTKALVFPDDFFMDYSANTYSIRLFTSDSEKEVFVRVTGTRDYDYLTKLTAFDAPEDVYYVIVSRNNCTYCQIVKPLLDLYFEFSKTHPATPRIYYIDSLKEPIPENVADLPEVLTGCDSGLALQNEYRIGTPTLFLVSNKKITNYTDGVSGVFTVLNNNQLSYMKSYYVK